MQVGLKIIGRPPQSITWAMVFEVGRWGVLMIWPGRNLALALVVPALMSLAMVFWYTPEYRFLLIVLDAVIGTVALLDLLSLMRVGPIRAERRMGMVVSLGEKHEVDLTLSNEGRRRTLVRVKDDLPPEFSPDPDEFLVRLPGRGLVGLSYEFVANRRGTFPMRWVYVCVYSRWCFWKRVVTVPCESMVRVYPDLKQISRYTLLARRDRLSVLGLRRTRKAGTDNEFERLRDYARGDEPRHIDWRASARRRKLTVREHQINQSQRVIFMIDAGRMMAGDVGEGLSPLDHAFNAMLMMAHVALVRGDQVGLMVYADRVRTYLPPGGGAHRVNRLVHAVHNIFPELVESRHDRAFYELERRCRKRSLVVLITNVFDDVGAQKLLDHLGNLVGRHLPLGVLLRDPDLFELADAGIEAHPSELAGDGLEVLSEPISQKALFESAAAASMLNWREQIVSGLRRRKVLILDVEPKDLTAPLVNKYLEIKARHLL